MQTCKPDRMFGMALLARVMKESGFSFGVITFVKSVLTSLITLTCEETQSCLVTLESSFGLVEMNPEAGSNLIWMIWTANLLGTITLSAYHQRSNTSVLNRFHPSNDEILFGFFSDGVWKKLYVTHLLTRHTLL
jgi:hypothetical protein